MRRGMLIVSILVSVHWGSSAPPCFLQLRTADSVMLVTGVCCGFSCQAFSFRFPLLVSLSCGRLASCTRVFNLNLLPSFFNFSSFEMLTLPLFCQLQRAVPTDTKIRALVVLLKLIFSPSLTVESPIWWLWWLNPTNNNNNNNLPQSFTLEIILYF